MALESLLSGGIRFTDRGIVLPFGENGFTIYYYAIIIVFGIIMATIVAAVLFRRRNIPGDWILDLLICVLPLGVVGARIYYCVYDGMPITEWFSFESIRNGGLAIYGGIIGGVIGVAIFCLIHKINFFRVADCAAPGVVLAQAIGRWGNFVNQEAHGAYVSDPNWQWFPFAVWIDKNGASEPMGPGWYQATFFYESMACLLIFIVLFILAWKIMKKPNGIVLCGYMILYGIERAFVEGLRMDSLMVGSIRVSQVLSVAISLSGVAILLLLLYLNRRKYGCVFGAVVGEPLAIIPDYRRMAQEKKEEAARSAKEKQVRRAAAEKKEKSVSAANLKARKDNDKINGGGENGDEK